MEKLKAEATTPHAGSNEHKKNFTKLKWMPFSKIPSWNMKWPDSDAPPVAVAAMFDHLMGSADLVIINHVSSYTGDRTTSAPTGK